MSGIFRRNRTETGLEFWDTAVEIKREVTRFLMNPNNVPKSYRFVFTFRIIGLTFDLRDAITRANTTFPVNEHEFDVGVMTMADITSAYESWRGYVGHMNAHKTIRTMDRLYFKLFGIMPKPKKGRR